MRRMDPPAKAGMNRWLRTIVAVMVGLVALKLLGWGPAPPQAVVEMRTDAGPHGELFYAGSGQEHSPDRRVPFALSPDGEWHTYRIPLPDAVEVERLRIDPGNGDGAVEIRSLAIEGVAGSTRLADGALAEAQLGTNLLTPVPQAPDEAASTLRFEAAAPDPYVDFRLSWRPGSGSSLRQAMPWLKVAGALALLWLTLGELARWLLAWARGHLSLPRQFGRAAACVSDPAVLVVSPGTVALVAAVACCAVLYVAMNLHQSSIGVWENLFAATPIEQTVDLGSPRQIRSDEWNTQTPWILSQVARGKHMSNAGIGGEEAPMLASVPLHHSSALAQAKFFGFYLFDAETGFSWWWAYKSFGLLLSFLWLFLLLTKGDLVASALGAAWVYGSSATQWWFSSNLPEVLIAFALATVGGIYLLFASRRLMTAVGAVLIGYGVLNLLLHLYPPFILPLAYLGAVILLGLMLAPGHTALFRQDLRWRVLCGSAIAVAAGLLAGNYLLDAMPSIRVMAETIYPGHRVSTSGSVPLHRMLYGYFEVFRVGEHRLPLPPTNPSEASSFVVLAPLLLLAIPFAALFRRRNALPTLLVLYCVIVGLWICVQLPGPVERTMQLAGWSWSPPFRAVLGLGIGSIVAVTLLFARARADDPDLMPRWTRRLVPVAVFVAVAWFGWTLKDLDPVFFRDRILLSGALASALVAAGAVLGRTSFFAAGLVLFLAPAMTVNPLVSGLSSLEDKPILVAARQHSEMATDRWAVVGSYVLSQGLKSHGLDVVTGSQMIPDSDMIGVLDPQGRYAEVWNRYAHVVLESDPDGGAPEYKLMSPDLYVVEVDVCGPELPALGVTRIAYTHLAPAADLRCLEPLDAPADSGVHLFRLQRQGAQAPTPTTSSEMK